MPNFNETNKLLLQSFHFIALTRDMHWNATNLLFLHPFFGHQEQEEGKKMSSFFRRMGDFVQTFSNLDRLQQTNVSETSTSNVSTTTSSDDFTSKSSVSGHSTRTTTSAPTSSSAGDLANGLLSALSNNFGTGASSSHPQSDELDLTYVVKNVIGKVSLDKDRFLTYGK